MQESDQYISSIDADEEVFRLKAKRDWDNCINTAIMEGAAKAKLNQYEENLRSAGYGEILKKTVRRRMGKPRNPVALEASASKITEFPDRERKS